MPFKLDYPQKVYLLIGFVSLLPFVAIGLLRGFDLFEFIELKTLDGRMRLTTPHSPPISPQIALITIDAKSEQILGSLPWPPYIYAALLDSLKPETPKAIGLIAWFDREWEDKQLLPGEKLFVIQPYSVANPLDRRALPEVTDWNSLPYSLSQAQGIGFSHFPLSHSDGISRSAQLVVKDLSTNDNRYSLEISILCQTYGISPTSIQLREGFWRGKFLEFHRPSGMPLRIPIDAQGQLLVRFAGDVSAFGPISFADVLLNSDTDQFQSRFRGKCVLIGITTEGVYKKASTPFGEMSALALRANLLNALLNHDFIWQLSRGGNLLYLACLAILFTGAAILIYRSKHGYRLMLLLGGGLMLCHLLFVFGLFVLFDIWLEVTASSLSLILGIGMTSLLLAHLRLRDMLWQLETTQAQLVKSEKEAVFGVMSARVRHELRNTLNLIRAPAEMIRNNFQKRDPLHLAEHPQEIVDEMNAIIGWVTKLDEMIENELSFFQETRLHLQRQQIEPVLTSALEMMQPVVSEKRIQLQLDLPAKVPSLPLDADKMRIVFANLVKNASQAMSPGGTLEIALAPSPPHHLTIIVRDTGSGISASDLDRIFEPFYTTKPRGLGLGLVNVKNIVEGHGGGVRVESEVGTGTTFFIELPL